jgi:hypothetical protein
MHYQLMATLDQVVNGMTWTLGDSGLVHPLDALIYNI